MKAFVLFIAYMACAASGGFLIITAPVAMVLGNYDRATLSIATGIVLLALAGFFVSKLSKE